MVHGRGGIQDVASTDARQRLGYDKSVSGLSVD